MDIKHHKRILLPIILINLAVFFGICLYFYFNRNPTGLDILINDRINSFHSDTLIKTSVFLSNIFDPVLVLIYSLIISLILLSKKRYNILKIFIGAIISTALSFQVIKIITQRARPFNILVQENSLSFPSGHTTIIVVFLGLVIFFFIENIKSKPLRYILTSISLLLITLVSASRLFLNAHWLSDVLAGLTLGTAIFCISVYIYIKEKDNKKKK